MYIKMYNTNKNNEFIKNYIEYIITIQFTLKFIIIILSIKIKMLK